MSKLDLTAVEAREVLWGDSDDYKVISDKLMATSRWSTIHELVIQRVSDGKYFMDSYSRGATECQEERPWEYSEPNFVEAIQAEQLVVTYRPIV